MHLLILARKVRAAIGVLGWVTGGEDQPGIRSENLE